MPKKTLLNSNQQKAINHQNGALLVVAGAGTGKTRVITERIKHLVQTLKVDSNEILALTFTEKASGEMVERIGDVMPLGYQEPWVYTFHSFADRILKKEGIEIGLDPGYKILPGPEQWLLLRKNLFKLDLKYFRPLGNPTKFISAILKFISRLQDENISPQDLNDYVEKNEFENKEEQTRWKELAHVYKAYQEIKLQNSKLDFGDLILWCLKLFEQRPNVLKKYQNQFKHMLVDEFQDTNYAQYELVKILFPKDEIKRSLVVVGDDSQSIYKFRGAAISNILEFMKDYPKAEMITLLENYRSTQKILDPAYKLIQNNNPDTLESKLGISKELVSKSEEIVINPVAVELDTLEDETNFVAKTIQEILEKEPHYTFKDFAILARANSHLEPFMLSLRQYGIPYQLIGNRGLYDKDEIRDTLSLLKVIINTEDNISLYRVLNIKSLEIGYAAISKILSSSNSRKLSIWSIIDTFEDLNVQLLKNTLQSFQQKIATTSPTDFIFELIKHIRYLENLLKEETIENNLAIKNMDIFLNIVKRFEAEFHSENNEFPTIINFVEYLDLIMDAGDNPGQAELEDIDTVNLLTVHASKGLEFPVVFIVNLVSDRFPTRDKSDVIEIPTELIKESLPTGNEHVQEERRLFYVGLTRARKYLYITFGKNYGGKREKKPSGFIGETGIEVVKNDKNNDTQAQSSLFGVGSSYRDSHAIVSSGASPEFLSYSQLDTYETCPLQYKYRYILKVPSLPNHALSFGTTIHDTLRDFHQMQLFKTVSLEELTNVYEKNWQPLGYIDQDHRQQRFVEGKLLIEDYYKKHANQKIQHIAIEKSFNININGTRFYGRIDRIDPLPSGGVEIIDYKTGNIRTQSEVDKDIQVALYALGVKEALGLNPELLSLYFVEKGEKVSTTRTEEQLDNIKDKISTTVEKLVKGDFEATPGMHCNWCDYREICPKAYKS